VIFFSAAAFVVVSDCAFAQNDSETSGLISAKMEASSSGIGLDARAAAIGIAQDEILLQILKNSFGAENPSVFRAVLDAKERYIHSSQLVRCETVDDATHVEIACQVDRSLLLRDASASALTRLMAPPTALVLVAEQRGADLPFSLPKKGTVEKELAKALKKSSFEILDSDSLLANHSESEILDAINADSDAASAFAREGFADVVILGVASVSNDKAVSGSAVPKSAGKVALRVFQSHDGKCVDSLAREASVHSANPDEGADAVFEECCAKLEDDAVVLSVMAVAGGRPKDELVIELEAPGSMERLDAFVKHFGDLSSRKDIDVLFYSDKLARVRARYDGAMIPLMDSLTHALYEGMALETRKAFQRNVRMRFVKP
jgi:hypothetical protein